MDDIKTVKSRLRLSVIALVFTAVIITVGFVYLDVTSNFDEAINQQQFETLISDERSLAEYYRDQAGYEAHFVTAANIIKEYQLRNVLVDLPLYLAPVLVITMIMAFVISRKLIDPIQESYDSKQRFMQDAAHELRNPLGAIKATTQTIIEEEGINKNIRDSIMSIQRQVDNLINLSNDLIFLEKNPGGEIVEVDVQEVAQDVLDQLRAMANDAEVKINLTCADKAVFKADTQDLVILIRNLLTNAIKYSKPEGGFVQLCIRVEKKFLEISVTDNGIGIAKHDLDKLGERFYRTNEAKGRSGSGLGLSIVKKITEKYKGDFSINSQLGKGTTVNVILAR